MRNTISETVNVEGNKRIGVRNLKLRNVKERT